MHEDERFFGNKLKPPILLPPHPFHPRSPVIICLDVRESMSGDNALRSDSPNRNHCQSPVLQLRISLSVEPVLALRREPPPPVVTRLAEPVSESLD